MPSKDRFGKETHEYFNRSNKHRCTVRLPNGTPTNYEKVYDFVGYLVGGITGINVVGLLGRLALNENSPEIFQKISENTYADYPLTTMIGLGIAIGTYFSEKGRKVGREIDKVILRDINREIQLSRENKTNTSWPDGDGY